MNARINKKASKKPLQGFRLALDDDTLDVGFVPLCGTAKRLTVCCPLCGIVMVYVQRGKKMAYTNEYVRNFYFCPECGIKG